MAGQNQSYSSPERVIDMLLAFAEPDTQHSVQSIAKAFGTSRSSTYRYLQILRRRALIEEDGAPGHYRLGRRIAAIARAARAGVDVVAVAEPVMRALAAETGETTMLTRCLADRIVCAACVESPQAVRISFEPARDLPLHGGSPARVHLAYLEATEISRHLSRPLEQLTSRTLVDRAAVRRDLASIRRRGYAISEGEVDADVRSISAPVFSRRDESPARAAAGAANTRGSAVPGPVVAGLTLAGPRFRLTRAALRDLIPAVVDAARQIGEAYARGTQSHAPERAASLRFIRL